MNKLDNNEKDKRINQTFFIVLGVLTIIIPFFIFETVYMIGDAPVYEKKDVLAYYGSTVGACFGGLITAAGLYFTLYQNSKTFEEQRNIDKSARNEERERFNKDYNNRIISQKIDNYKDIYVLLNEVNNMSIAIRTQIDIQANIYNVKGCKQSDAVSELINLLGKYDFMEIYLIEDILLDLSKELMEKRKELNDGMLKYAAQEIDDEEYCKYLLNLEAAIVKLFANLKIVSKKIHNDKFYILNN